MEWKMRPIREEELETWYRVVTRAEGRDLTNDELKYGGLGIHLDRTLAVFDDDLLVGTAHNELADMNVPGGRLQTAVVAYVGTQSTHRRRGILTAMMKRQLEDLHDEGVPLANLQASETVIYGRFGYGIGAFCEDWSIERHHTAFARTYEWRGRTKFILPDQMRKIFPDVCHRATASRPGMVPLSDHRWDVRVWDLEFRHSGASGYLHIVYEQDGVIDGYVTYRVKGESLIIRELMAVTDEAYAALWRYCFDVDLRTSTVARDRPVDDPLLWMLADPRRLRRSLRDGAWLRLVDVPTALASRCYSGSGSLVIELLDPFCSWNQGRYILEGGPDGAQVARSNANPDLVMSAAELAAGYLGTVSFTELAHAGRIEERKPGTLALANEMFSAPLKPWSPDPWAA